VLILPRNDDPQHGKCGRTAVFTPPAKPEGRPRTTDARRLLDGLFYLVRTPCPDGAWRVGFWSADWTPWSAVAMCRARWPALDFQLRVVYAAD
jgi:transposase